MTDPLTRVPGIWRAGMRVAFNGEHGTIIVSVTWGLVWSPDKAPPWRLPVPAEVEGEPWASADFLNDPTGATTGVLQTFCRELYGEPRLSCAYHQGRQLFEVVDLGRVYGRGVSDSEAWEVAILAHPSISETRSRE